ncbi:hypothetical protein [Nitrosomonas sp.]|uniref:hypothetical protein n=1 Tax=Nitrosomonas sp. TaxID=42353 RepID=UPI0037C73EB9
MDEHLFAVFQHMENGKTKGYLQEVLLTQSRPALFSIERLFITVILATTANLLFSDQFSGL